MFGLIKKIFIGLLAGLINGSTHKALFFNQSEMSD